VPFACERDKVVVVGVAQERLGVDRIVSEDGSLGDRRDDVVYAGTTSARSRK